MHMNPMNLSFGDKSTKHLTPHGKHHRSFVEKQKKKKQKRKENISSIILAILVLLILISKRKKTLRTWYRIILYFNIYN